MAEYIEKEQAINIVDKILQNNKFLLLGERMNLNIIKDNIFSIPATDVQPVKRGKWIAENRDSRGYADCYTCTNCNCYSYTYTLMKDCEYEYCPNCGAKMSTE